MTMLHYLERLERLGGMSAIHIGAALGIEGYQELLEGLQHADDERSPQSAVASLVDLLESNDSKNEAEAAGLIDETLAAALTGRSQPTVHDVYAALRELLGDVWLNRSLWGLATARRPHAPNTEIVKLVQGEQRIVREPTLHAHVFELELRERWTITAIDTPEIGWTAGPLVPNKGS